MTIKNILSILKIHQHLDIIDIFEFKNVNEIQIDNEIKEIQKKHLVLMVFLSIY